MPTEKRERQRERRAEKKAQEQAAARRQRLLKLLRNGAIIAVVVVVGGLVFNVIGSDDSPTTTTVAQQSTDPTATTPVTTPAVPTNYAEFRDAPTACGATRPPAAQEVQFEAPEDQGIDPAATVRATIRTSCGDIVLELDPAAAPETTNSFVFLARQGYFDGTVSHRVVPGFVIQAGDPTATGTGGPGYVVPDELPETGFDYGRGVVAMANAGPGTTGSQFFLVLDTTGLNNDFSVFGTVAEGLDVMDRIVAEVPRQARFPGGEPSTPLEAVYINEVVIEITG